jgi:hypothetical protein
MKVAGQFIVWNAGKGDGPRDGLIHLLIILRGSGGE